MTEIKKEIFIVAFIKFAEMWANNNIGSNIEVNIPKLVSYAKSNKFNFIDSWGMKNNIDDYYKIIEDLILEGFPIWNFFHISEWTRNMLELDFKNEIDKYKQERENEFICLRGCKWFSSSETSMGVLERCNHLFWKRITRFERRIFKVRKKCKYFEKEI